MRIFTILTLVLIAALCTSVFAAFSDDDRFSVSGDMVSLSGYSHVFNTLYLWDGSSWNPLTCSGPSIGNGWLSSCSYNLNSITSTLGPGTYSLAGYACDQVGQSFNCNGGKWLLTSFDVTSTGSGDAYTSSPGSWVTTPAQVPGDLVRIQYSATPQANGIDSITAFSDIEGTSYGQYPILIRFYTDGFIDARNGGVYQKDRSVSYTAGSRYDFDVLVDLINKKYSVYVTPQGGAKTLVAENYDFRTDRSGASDISFMGLIAERGSHTVSNLQLSLQNPPECNGVLDAGEVCDGNSRSCSIGGYSGTQACNSQCTGFNSCLATQYCGDGIKNGNEFCDDGNSNNDDSCPNDCSYKPSGDNECSDGIDNDGDGLIDFGDDLGCYHWEDGSEGALPLAQENGWHTWDPHPRDTNIIYVSESSGSDTNPGTKARPVKSIQKGMDMMRSGKPDWLLLKSGDVWEEEFIVTSTSGGPSEEFPMIIGAYGVGDRPKIMPPADEHGIKFTNHNIGYVVVNGLYINGDYRRPGSPNFDENMGKPGGIKGIWMTIGTGEDKHIHKVTIQDNRIDFFDSNTHTVDQWASRQYDGSPGRMGLDIRRNIFEFAISDDAHAIGSYIEGTKGSPVVVENYYYHNGWYQLPNEWNSDVDAVDPRKKEEHNIYGQRFNAPLTVYGNIFAAGATTGIQMRAGGDLICNALVGNAIAAWVARKSDEVSYNIVYNATNIEPGLWGNDNYGGTKSLKYYKDKRGFGLQVSTNSDVINNWVVKNDDYAGDDFALDVTSGSRLQGNVVASWDARSAGPIKRGGEFGVYGQTVLDNYDKTFAKYARSIGLAETEDAFYEAARNRGRGEWPQALTAQAIYKYFSGQDCPDLDV